MNTDSILSRDEAVAALVRHGVPLDVAERRLPVLPTVLAMNEHLLEKEEQREVVKLYRAYGCVVYSLSQARATKQSPGLPDLRVFAPRVNYHFEHETKRQGVGETGLSPAQREYRSWAQVCGLDVVVGDRFAAAEQLVMIGLARRIPGGIEPIRPGAPRSHLPQGEGPIIA